MSTNRKEEIILTTLELAAEKGLAGVSMSMIADKIGIKKPSLYKHFSSKEEIVEAMYQFLREQSKKNANIKPVDFSQLFQARTFSIAVLSMAPSLYPKIWFRGGFDILVTHAPAYQLNDGRDLPHQGFKVFRKLMEKYHPKYFLHGHVHMSYGRKHKRYDKYEETNVVNAFDRCVFEFEAEEPEKQFG